MIYRKTIGRVKSVIAFSSLLLALMTPTQIKAGANTPGALPSQAGVAEPAPTGAPATPHTDETEMGADEMDHVNHHAEAAANPTPEVETGLPATHSDAHLPQAATHADGADAHQHEQVEEEEDAPASQHEPAEHGHGAVAPSISSTTKGLILGGFGAVNGFVLVAAAILKRRTAHRTQRQSAGRVISTTGNPS